MLTVAEMIRYRLRHERYIHRVAESPVHTRYGDFTMIAYESEVNGGESHLALVRGPVGRNRTGNTGDTPTLVRVHSHCLPATSSAPPPATAASCSSGRSNASRKQAGAH